MREDPGVAAAEGSVDGEAQLIGDDGKAIVYGGAPNLGFSIANGESLFNPLTPVDERERVEDGVAVGDREAEVRRAAVDDRLAVVADELRVAVDAALGRGDPGTWRTSASSESSSSGCVSPLPSEMSKADLPVITAVEPCRDSVKIESNALSIESVRT